MGTITSRFQAPRRVRVEFCRRSRNPSILVCTICRTVPEKPIPKIRL